MTYQAEPASPVPIVVDVHPCGVIATRSMAHCRVVDDDEIAFGVLADTLEEAQLIAERVSELLNERGLADVPDSLEAVSDE